MSSLLVLEDGLMGMLMANKDEDLQHVEVVAVVMLLLLRVLMLTAAAAGARTATWKECTPIITSLAMLMTTTKTER